MAQAMLGLKTFATEKGDAHRTMEEEEEDIDGESLGSQDSVLEGETEDEMEKAELVEKETNIQSKKKSNHPMSQKRKSKTEVKNRGKYRSWARFRVIIHQALRDAVFDRKRAAEILKRGHRIYIPSSVIGYYARKLSPSISSSSSFHPLIE
ncbi:22 kDa protein [Pigeon adenovirus 2a]|nr:22 kDa protein [Pigeon adenovirus 2a]